VSRVQIVDLGFTPRPWQAECLKKLKRFSVLVIHRRAGKTVLAILSLIDAALQNKKDSPRYAYIAPKYNQAKDVAWSYIKHYARMVPGTTINEAETWVCFPGDKRIRIYGADNPDGLRGLYLDGAVLDEVAQMKPDLWDEVILPTLADRQGWALFIGTPKGVNRFSELYDHARVKPGWYAALFDVTQTDALPPAEIELARAEMSEQKFAQEYLCDFSASSEDVLIPLSLAMPAKGKHLVLEAYQFAAKVIGVDVARQGGDRTVIFRRQGLASFTPKVLNGADSMTVASVVAREVDDWGADAVMVDGSGGYGAGVIDRLRSLNYDISEVQFGGKPADPRYANKRVEMYCGVRDWLQAGGALPDDTSLVRELSAATYDHDNARGVLALESKDDIKARIGLSPDLADALALTFAYPVLARRGAGGSSVRVTGADFDPYATRN
jgi:hypothetical protein